jgi:hypothetical protein
VAEVLPLGSRSYVVYLDDRDDKERSERILKRAVLQIDDRVTDLYVDAAVPENVSELEKDNYRG